MESNSSSCEFVKILHKISPKYPTSYRGTPVLDGYLFVQHQTTLSKIVVSWSVPWRSTMRRRSLICNKKCLPKHQNYVEYWTFRLCFWVFGNYVTYFAGFRWCTPVVRITLQPQRFYIITELLQVLCTCKLKLNKFGTVQGQGTSASGTPGCRYLKGGSGGPFSEFYRELLIEFHFFVHHPD